MENQTAPERLTAHSAATEKRARASRFEATAHSKCALTMAIKGATCAKNLAPFIQSPPL